MGVVVVSAVMMRVGMPEIAVPVHVLVNEIHRGKQSPVAKYLIKGPFRGKPMLLIQDDDAAGQIGYEVEVMR